MSDIRLAFLGFRHGHITSLYDLAAQLEGVRIVGACEEHAPTRAALQAGGAVDITHDDAARLLAEVDCDAVAVGDAFGLRGARAIAALEAGRHVIVDKPLCTRLEELAQIRTLAAAGKLQVGCMLTMRDAASTIAARQLIRQGTIGQVHAIQFGGQHPLMLNSRPDWYWEPGLHGGTINDIGIHAIDSIPFVTGLSFHRLEAARCWNAFAPEVPHFQDGAQMLLTMDNGCGVIGDVSYHAPDASGYSMSYYWRTTYWGREGVIETATNADHLALTTATGGQTERRQLPPGNRGGYFRAFLKTIRGETLNDGEPSTQAVLDSSARVLRIQAAADANERGVDLT
ncbi:MAG: Gfo/Idh/MocA family oxidoreductase [bacterium]|nr:Gfo/Idh/MocA family oxidoreductase [bacterium]